MKKKTRKPTKKIQTKNNTYKEDGWSCAQRERGKGASQQRAKGRGGRDKWERECHDGGEKGSEEEGAAPSRQKKEEEEKKIVDIIDYMT